jgi:hypothetical protein
VEICGGIFGLRTKHHRITIFIVTNVVGNALLFHNVIMILTFSFFFPVLTLLSPYFGQIRRWAAIEMGLKDIRAACCWIGLARGFGLNCPCICIIMLEYDSV